MIRTMIDGGFQAHAGVGADAAAVAGRDQRNLGAGAASLAVGILEAAPLLAIVRAVGIAIGPDEGAGIAHLELDVDLLRSRVRADLEGIVGADVGFEVAGRPCPGIGGESEPTVAEPRSRRPSLS